MPLTLQQKRNKADQFFDRLYNNLQIYYQDEGFHTISITKINIFIFEEIDVYFRVTGTAQNANLDVCVNDDGTTYVRRDTVVSGQRNEGTWQQINVTLPSDVRVGPPYSVLVKDNIAIAF